ncbi:MAG: hypothetical protein MSB12_04535 [Lentisphaeraceae bacterium]|nr:hypothetical protein [Lentisphaeraceae bacterium]
MKTITRFAAALLAVIGLSAFAWADIQVDNVSALSGLVASGETYSFVQFRLDDQRFTVTGAAELGNVVWVKSIGVVQRPDYTIAENSTLRIQRSTAENETSGISSAQNEAVIAISQPLALSSTEALPVGTLRTYTFAAPFPLKKNTLYTAKFYNASGTAENQSIAMYNDSTNQTTQNKNTTIHASADALFSPCVRIIAVEPSKLADVGASANWSGLWGEEPTEMDTVGLNVTAANAALTMGTTATVAGLAIGSETAVGPLTLTGSGSLTSTTTTIATDTDVSAITASLGAVSIGSGKTLTIGANGTFTALTGAGGALCFKGRTVSPGGTVDSELLKTFNGSMTLRDGADVTLLNSYTLLSGQRFIADSGTSALMLYAGSDRVADEDEDETIQVKNGAQLTLKARDLGGWQGYAGANLVVAVRGKDSKITADSYTDQPGCFVGRVVLADGGEIEGGSESTASLNFFGDTSGNADYPEIYVPSGTGTWSGYLWRNKGLIVKVEEDATFVLSGILKSKNTNNQALKKVGAGEMKITANQAENSGDYIINEGTLTFVTEDELTLSNTIFGSGTVKKSGAGTLSLTGTVSTSVTVSAGTLKLRASVPSGSITVAGGRLEMPLPSSAKTVAAEGNEGTLVLILTDAQVAQGNLPTQLSWTGDVSKVEVRNSNGALLPRTVSKDNESGVLVLSTRAALTKKWTSGSASWEAGLSGFALGDDVVFGNNASGTITVPVKTTVGEMTVNGTYAFSLSPGGLTASTITVAGSAKATFTPLAVNYVRLQLDNANGGDGDNAVPGVSELILTKGGTKVDWPQGTTIKQVNLDGSTTDPDWAPGGNEKVKALIDGVWNGSGKGLTYTNPYDGSGDTTYSGAYVSVNNNKWWPRGNAKAYAVISLGKAIDFDGYKLMTTDYWERSAKNWTLEVSADGKTWFVADSRTDRSVPNTNSFYVYDNESGSTIFPVVDPVKIVSAPIVVESHGILGGSAKITDDVTFKMGAYLDATTKQPLEITGTVTATGTEEYPAGMILVTLPENEVVWPVLKTTTEGLAAKLVCPGYEFHYREGTYWATLTVTAEVTTNSNLTDLTWKRADNGKAIDAATREHLFALPEVTATLNTTRDAAVTINCATVPALTLSGTAAVTLSAAENVTPTIASLTVAADSTVAAELLERFTGKLTLVQNSSLTLDTSSTITLRGALSGSGAITFDGTGEVNVTAANGEYKGLITINSGATLTNKDHGQPIPFGKGRIVNNGTLKLIAAQDAYKYGCALLPPTSGTGDIVFCSGSETRLPAPITTTGTITFEGKTSAEATDAAKVTFVTSGDFPDQEEEAFSISGASLVVGDGVTLDNDDENAATSPKVKIASDATLSGTGTISVPVTFENGSVIKAVDSDSGAVTCSDTVTLPETGTVTVLAKAYGAAVLKKSGLDVAKFALPTEAGESWMTAGLFTEQGGTLLLVAKPTFTPPDGTPAMSDETARVIAELAAEKGKFGVTTVAVAAGRNPAAVEVFKNVMTVKDATPTKATISYDFGVADMTIKSLQLSGDKAATMYVLLAAKVQNSADSNTASFAEGTKLTVLNGTKEITPTKVSAAVATGVADAEETTDVQWLAVPLATLFPEGNSLGTRSLKVKASKASN